jgi:membrane associated rhomboid family serine protease
MGGNFLNSVVGRLILANLAVFLLMNVLPYRLIVPFALTPRVVIENFYLWQIFTYMFLHAGFSHLFFNMLMLWLFGSALENIWGGRRFLNYYVACGVGGALFSFLFNYNNLILGASGAIFGLYLAYAVIFPDNYIYLYFLLPVKAKYLIAFLATFQLLLGLSGPSHIAYFAHLGGMAAGLLFFRREVAKTRWFNRLRLNFRKSARPRPKRKPDETAENIDSILDKIHSKGYDNLSPTEKRILENYSRKKKEQSDDR